MTEADTDKSLQLVLGLDQGHETHIWRAARQHALWPVCRTLNLCILVSVTGKLRNRANVGLPAASSEEYYRITDVLYSSCL